MAIHGQDFVLNPVLPLLARTAEVSSDWFSSKHCRGVILYLNVTAVTLTPGLTLTIEGQDPVSLNAFPVATYTAVAPTGADKFAFTLFPGSVESVTLAKHESNANVLPSKWRISVAVADTDSATYSVGGHLIP